MPPIVVLALGFALVYYAYRADRKRGDIASSALFWPCLWYVVVATRPAGVWLNMWGVPMPEGGDATDGSIIDRLFYGGLTLIGLSILSRRRFQWNNCLRQNRWLVALLILMSVSIVWSNYPYVSFKRYIKVLGSVVMACVILTEPEPLQAFLTVVRRCLYIHLPMSIICTRWYRQIGVSFDWNGTTETWQGISTSKNTLGQIAMLGVVVFLWEIRRHWPQFRWRNIQVLFLFMALYLLKGAGGVSMTSVSVCVFAVAIFLRLQALRQRPWAARRFVLSVFFATSAMILFVAIHSVVMFREDSIFGQMITLLGRDITLTDRTNIWHDVYAAVKNPLLGVGYGGFWIGREANIPWNATMTWVLGQGHSGYVDTYLQIGFLGVALLLGVLTSGVFRLLRTLENDFDFSCFRLTLLLTIIFVNMTESIYLRGDHHLWLILMVVLWQVPVPPRPATKNPPGQPVFNTVPQPAERRVPRYYG